MKKLKSYCLTDDDVEYIHLAGVFIEFRMKEKQFRVGPCRWMLPKLRRRLISILIKTGFLPRGTTRLVYSSLCRDPNVPFSGVLGKKRQR